MPINGNYLEHVYGDANQGKDFEFAQIVTASYGTSRAFKAVEKAVVTQERRRARWAHIRQHFTH